MENLSKNQKDNNCFSSKVGDVIEEYAANFRENLILWGNENFRTFPWRYTANPYHILIAEVLLHRTQAKQVVNVYIEFINKFPDIQTLSGADPEIVKEVVRPLGLFWRSDLILSLAHELFERFNAQVPSEKEDLMSLPGVGDYIASSVRCFAFNKPDAIIDTNVVRVVTRVAGVPFRDSLRRNKSFRKIVENLIDPENPKAYNFALLDLANKVCLPDNPLCSICPINSFCKYNCINQIS